MLAQPSHWLPGSYMYMQGDELFIGFIQISLGESIHFECPSDWLS